MEWTSLESEQDASVNHIGRLAGKDAAMVEARFVQRSDDYFIAYLSSHTGCSHSCRFCHLTATGQTKMTAVDAQGYLAQLEKVMQTWRARRAAGAVNVQRVHVNFMARGEALSNPVVTTHSRELFGSLADRLAQDDIRQVRFCVSSIIPRDFDLSAAALQRALDDDRAVLYYSLYSVNPAFRKRWLPKAHPAEAALDAIATYQQRTGRDVVIHGAFIEGGNDAPEDVDAIVAAVRTRGIRAKFNLVRYNPYSPRLGREPEPDRLQALFARMAAGLGHADSRVVPRVGYDVKASCGMFVSDLPTAMQVTEGQVAEGPVV